MSPLQFLSWLAQTATFTGIAFNFFVIAFGNGNEGWIVFATIPLTIGLGFIWLITHLLSSIIVKNTMSKLGLVLAFIWLIVNTIFVYLFMNMNKQDPDELIFAFVGFNVIYPFIAVILPRNFTNQNLASSNKKPFLLTIKFQIALSIFIAAFFIYTFTEIFSF